MSSTMPVKSKNGPDVTLMRSPFAKSILSLGVSMQGGEESAHGHSFTVLTERGNVRAIDASDSAFSVPADFTKES